MTNSGKGNQDDNTWRRWQKSWGL